VELPIDIKVEGGFHEFGAFVSGVAGMPRIVTLHDFEIVKNVKAGSLVMNIQAKTYRYKEQE
jgi:type IV pilus assembly protein PilO